LSRPVAEYGQKWFAFHAGLDRSLFAQRKPCANDGLQTKWKVELDKFALTKKRIKT
jgi:hypothetical protein